MPDWKPEIRRRLTGLSLSPLRENAIVEELAQDLDDCYAALLASGMAAAEAYEQTLAELSESELLAEELRRVEKQVAPEPIILGTNRRTNMIADLWQDLRFGARTLLKQPGFTLIAVITLALGIGATTAVFSVVNAVLLRSLPYAQAERDVLVWGGFAKLNIPQLPAKAAEYVDYRDRIQSFAQVAAFATDDLTLTGGGEPSRVSGARVTANLFPLLGAQALHGRIMAEEETQSGRNQVVVISHAFWQKRMGGAASALGQTLRLNDTNYTIIGVMPATFAFPHPSFDFAEQGEVWTPLVLDAEAIAQRHGPWGFNVLAQLKPQATVQQAQAELNALAEQHVQVLGFKAGYRGPNGEDGGWRITVTPLQEQVVGASRRALWLLLGAVLLVLLIACVNVANLLLVRATVRQQELAIRAALGAGRAQLMRQLLVESSLLAGLAGALGAGLAWLSVKAVVWLNPATLPRAAEVTVDGRVLAFTLLVSVLTGVLSGLAPALQVGQASQINWQEMLQAGGAQRTRSQRRWREWLVVTEVALAVPLLMGAGLLLNSFIRVLREPSGIAVEQMLVAELHLPGVRYREPARRAAFFAELAQRVAALPGVAAASYTTRPILNNTPSSDPFAIEGRPTDTKQPNFAGWQGVAPAYFRTLGVPLVAGREFTASDEAGAPVAVINETLARRYFPKGGALGQGILLGGVPSPNYPFAKIIGIAKDVPHRNVESPAEPEMFLQYMRRPHSLAWLYVRVAGEPSSFAAMIRQTVLSIDREQPVKSIQPLPAVITATMAPRRFTTWLLGGFALLALVLAASGIYSVNAYTVAQRMREIGIRMALGAQARDVLRLILQRGLSLVLVGLALGVGASLLVTRWLKSLLFGVTTTDPPTFGVIVLLLLLVALLACWIPARRATQVDPLAALRHE